MLDRLQSRTCRGILVVFGSCLMMITSGTLYIYGNISSYLVSYIHYYDSSINYGNASFIFSFAMSCGVSTVLIGLLEKYLSIRMVALISATVFATGTFLTGFSCKSFIGTLFTYGILNGIGGGMCYCIGLVCGMRWFPGHKGLINGIVLASYGLGALFFNPVVTLIINPHNVSIPKDMDYYPFENVHTVPRCFIILGITYFFIDLIGISLITNPTEKEPRDSNFSSDLLLASRTSNHSSPGESINDGLSIKDSLKQYQFYFLWYLCAICTLGVTVSSTFWKTMGQENKIFDDLSLSIVGSCSAIFNALGRVFWGTLYDCIGFQKSLGLSFLLAAGLYCSFPFILNKFGYSIFVCLLFFVTSAGYAQFPTETATCFGQKNFATLYGMIFTSLIAGSMGASALCSFLIGSIGLEGMFYLVGSIYFLNFLIFVLFYHSLDWKTREAEAKGTSEWLLTQNLQESLKQMA